MVTNRVTASQRIKQFNTWSALAMTMAIGSMLSCTIAPATETIAAISPPNSPPTDTVTQDTVTPNTVTPNTATPNTATQDTVVTLPASDPVADSRASDQAAAAKVDPSEENTVEPAALDLEGRLLKELNDAQGSPYGEVRQLLLEHGWIPHTFATTTGSPSNYVTNSVVQQMENLGFQEIKDCSGTGQGFCLFEFVYQDRTAEFGPVLQITTAAAAQSAQNYPEPIFWDYSLGERSVLTYLEHPFSQTLLTQLRDQESFCLSVGRCDPVQYMLKDGLLVASSGDFGSTKMTLIPTAPVSKDDGLEYAKILDVEGRIDFSIAHVDHDLMLEQYSEPLPAADGLADLGVGSITTTTLRLTPNGRVSEISFSMSIL